MCVMRFKRKCQTPVKIMHLSVKVRALARSEFLSVAETELKFCGLYVEKYDESVIMKSEIITTY